MEHPCAHLADLVRINDMLAWSRDNVGSFISAVAIIKELSVLHPTCFGIGLLMAAASARWGWPTFQVWRRGH